MSSKIEARRFSGKPDTWAHYEMAVRAHLAVVDLIEFLHNGDGLIGDPKADAGPLFISRPEIVQRANGPSVGHKPGHSGFV